MISSGNLTRGGIRVCTPSPRVLGEPVAGSSRFDVHQKRWKANNRYEYKFRKLIGHGCYIHYRERYMRPTQIANVKRMAYPKYPGYVDNIRSAQWMWQLPKWIAKSTTTDQVLDTWVYYRHKVKHPSFYFLVLKRLLDIGGCDNRDWRYRLIVSRLPRLWYRPIVNLPRLALYLGKFKSADYLQRLGVRLGQCLHLFTPGQLAQICFAHSACRSRDERLFRDIRALFLPAISSHEVTAAHMLRVVEAHASCFIFSHQMCVEISAELQKRVALASSLAAHNAAAAHDGVGATEVMDAEVEKYSHAPRTCTPSIDQLADFGENFATLKYQDYSFFAMCSLQLQHLITTSGPLTPPIVAKAVAASCRLSIVDVDLFTQVLKHIHEFYFDYPPSSLSTIALHTAPLLPMLTPITKTWKKIVDVLIDNSSMLDISTVDTAAAFLWGLKQSGSPLQPETEKQLSTKLAERVCELQQDSKTIYNAPRLLESLIGLGCRRKRPLMIIVYHMHRHFPMFEPHDCVRFARAMLWMKNELSMIDTKSISVFAKRCIRISSELSPYQWEETSKCLVAFELASRVRDRVTDKIEKRSEIFEKKRQRRGEGTEARAEM